MSSLSHSDERLLIIGGSARAAADSALRAGFIPAAIDAFGDLDLSSRCSTKWLPRWPSGVEIAARQFDDSPWIYTGGLENYTRLIGKLSAERCLYGNDERAVRAVRDPLKLARALSGTGASVPEMSRNFEHTPRTGWLVKRRRSAGGLHVVPFDESYEIANRPRDAYLQRCIEGRSLGALYLSAAGRTLFLGAMQSRRRTTRPESFLYAGSIGPLPLQPQQRAILQLIGERLGSTFSLNGLFGVDVVWHEEQGKEQCYVLEVNPRYTASVELLERVYGVSTLRWHVEASRTKRLAEEAIAFASQLIPTTRLAGKAICYTEEAIEVDSATAERWWQMAQAERWPSLADIPRGGSRIERGQPIATVYAEGTNIGEVEERLQIAERRLLADCRGLVVVYDKR